MPRPARHAGAIHPGSISSESSIPGITAQTLDFHVAFEIPPATTVLSYFCPVVQTIPPLEKKMNLRRDP